jgi:hypothetical protein
MKVYEYQGDVGFRTIDNIDAAIPAGAEVIDVDFDTNPDLLTELSISTDAFSIDAGVLYRNGVAVTIAPEGAASILRRLVRNLNGQSVVMSVAEANAMTLAQTRTRLRQHELLFVPILYNLGWIDNDGRLQIPENLTQA